MFEPSKTFALFVAIYLISFQFEISFCQNVWRQGTGTGKEYLGNINQGLMNFNEANVFCKSVGGALPMIKNKFEFDAVRGSWLGAKRVDRKFFWLDGREVDLSLPGIKWNRYIDYNKDGIFVYSYGEWSQ